jgi:ribosomal-protein-alanine N-acetyltransferase
MGYTFTPMTEGEAHEIVAWHYEAPYDFYDIIADPEQHSEILDPDYRRKHYYAARDENGEQVGFFEYQPRRDELHIGLGLRPDLTGKGLGRGFVEAGVDFGRELYSPARFTLEVAKFNARATKLYQMLGFTITGESAHEIQGRTWPFHEMTRPA